MTLSNIAMTKVFIFFDWLSYKHLIALLKRNIRGLHFYALRKILTIFLRGSMSHHQNDNDIKGVVVVAVFDSLSWIWFCFYLNWTCVCFYACLRRRKGILLCCCLSVHKQFSVIFFVKVACTEMKFGIHKKSLTFWVSSRIF